MGIDFSGLNKLAYKGFEDAEARDSLLEAGYTIANDVPTPFTEPQAPPPPPDHRGDALTDHTGSRSYKKLYRAAHDFHQRHNPPTVERSYWTDHRPGTDEPPEAELSYWTELARDVGETAAAYNNDPFLTALLSGIMEELEREYKAIQAEAWTLSGEQPRTN